MTSRLRAAEPVRRPRRARRRRPPRSARPACRLFMSFTVSPAPPHRRPGVVRRRRPRRLRRSTVSSSAPAGRVEVVTVARALGRHLGAGCRRAAGHRRRPRPGAPARAGCHAGGRPRPRAGRGELRDGVLDFGATVVNRQVAARAAGPRDHLRERAEAAQAAAPDGGQGERDEDRHRHDTAAPVARNACPSHDRTRSTVLIVGAMRKLSIGRAVWAGLLGVTLLLGALSALAVAGIFESRQDYEDKLADSYDLQVSAGRLLDGGCAGGRRPRSQGRARRTRAPARREAFEEEARTADQLASRIRGAPRSSSAELPRRSAHARSRARARSGERSRPARQRAADRACPKPRPLRSPGGAARGGARRGRRRHPATP